MRISDWSSDVCSSDLALAAPDPCASAPPLAEPWTSWTQSGSVMAGATLSSAPRLILGKPVTATLRPAPQVQFVVPPGRSVPKSHAELGRASCRESVCQYV